MNERKIIIFTIDSFQDGMRKKKTISQDTTYHMLWIWWFIYNLWFADNRRRFFFSVDNRYYGCIVMLKLGGKGMPNKLNLFLFILSFYDLNCFFSSNNFSLQETKLSAFFFDIIFFERIFFLCCLLHASKLNLVDCVINFWSMVKRLNCYKMCSISPYESFHTKRVIYFTQSQKNKKKTFFF